MTLIRNLSHPDSNVKKRELSKHFCNLVNPISSLFHFYAKYKNPFCSNNSNGIIKGFGANSYRGLIKRHNEAQVSIAYNVSKPQNYKGKLWPEHLSIFCLFDGHFGSGCSNFLRDNFHTYLVNNELFPRDVEKSIFDTFAKLENDFITYHALSPDNYLLDRSGSCAIVTVIVDKTAYIAHVGNSRAIMSTNFGKHSIQITQEHKPNLTSEKKRIKDNDGEVYKVNSMNNEYRVLPGNLSMSRTIGDASSKNPFLGGKLGAIISIPEITKINLDDNVIDFILMGSSGIFDKLDNKELITSMWLTLNNKYSYEKTIHSQVGICSDMAIKSAMFKNSKDNVSSIFISFSNFEQIYVNQRDKFILSSFDNNNNVKYIDTSIKQYNILPL